MTISTAAPDGGTATSPAKSVSLDVSSIKSASLRSDSLGTDSSSSVATATASMAPAAYVHWRLSENDELVDVQSSVQLPIAIQERCRELCEAAIRIGETRTCVLSSPTPLLVVAALSSSTASECLTVLFQCQLNDLGEEAVETRARIAEHLAKQLIEEVPVTDAAPASPVSTQPRVSSHFPAPTDPSQELLTWSQLAGQAKEKLTLAWQHHRARHKFYTAAIALFACMAMLPWNHSINCDVVCEPAIRRYVAAPFDARLLKSHVVIGQQVKAGELLATLDGVELTSQIASANARLAQAEQRQLAALSTGDHSKAEFERLEIEHLVREIELMQRRKTNLDIRSPINGVVVTGDLERAEGAPLSVGDNLFEIGSLERLIAQVAVPENKVSFVESAMPVSIFLDSAPDRTLQTQIKRIHLRNEIRENQSIFVAETELTNDGLRLRPGMNGTASIDAGRKPIGWILFHRPYNAIRQWIGW